MAKKAKGKKKEGGEEKKQSVRSRIAGVAVTLRQALTLIDDAIGHLDEAELDGARDATMRAMDIIADERLHTQLDGGAEEIQEKMDAIEDIESGLL